MKNSIILVILLSSVLSACGSTSKTYVGENPHFIDLAFYGYDQIKVEQPEQVFELGDEARLFVKENITRVVDHHERMDALTRAIFGLNAFNLQYDNGANTIAQKTFENKTANCLSMSIMAFAMANEAGLNVTFQEVNIPEYWTRRSGYSLLNGHVNLRISAGAESGKHHLIKRDLILDFNPFNASKRFSVDRVSKERILSMFYNNKGADALVAADYVKAYAYLRAAIESDNSFQSPWINLGLLYRLTGHHHWAENTYLQAIQINPDNLTVWENLAILHEMTGREKDAQEIFSRVSRKRMSNPFYHYIKGEEMLEKEEYSEAIKHFKKAIDLDSKKHEFYFGLAKSYYALGDVNKSQKYLKRAKRITPFDDDKNRYQGKLDFLSKI